VLPTAQQAVTMTPWERFGVELILSFLVVLTYCGATDPSGRILNSQTNMAPFAIGGAYLVCSLVLVSTAILDETNDSPVLTRKKRLLR